MKHGIIIICSLLTLALPVSDGIAKKRGKDRHENPRLLNLNAEEKEMFDSLTKKQQKNLQEGKIETGYNAWMVKKALGEPYYTSEHHPVFTDYEEVWLYTKEVIDKQYEENKIMDPQTNWPTIHKFTRIKTCTQGDFFLLYDRGVVDKIVRDTSTKIYGSCTITTSEEFLPIVDGKAKGL
ncbi:MAG: hypothetical protein HQM16_08535 [Deltaproteobacteria bacterium]|nr:hypothetical protein [Deltaproteobacteria bacterium]